MRLFAILTLALFGCTTPTSDDTPGDDTDNGDDTLDPAADEDGDGISNGEEEEMGLDPYATDSDDDGFDDADEIAAGTNPTWKWSHTYEDGDYLIGNCPTHPEESAAGPTGTGEYNGTTWDAYQEGDILENIAVGGTDSFGQEVTAYAFCGNYTLITVSAEWCGPCQALASTMAEEMADIQGKYPNFTFFEYLYQDKSYETADQSVLKKWSKSYDLDGIPVVAPADQTEASDEINALKQGAGIPSTTLVAPDMTVIWSSLSGDGYYLDSARLVKAAIKQYEDSLEAQ